MRTEPSVTPRGARFTTITGDDWKRSLAAARVRRKGTNQRILSTMKPHEEESETPITDRVFSQLYREDWMDFARKEMADLERRTKYAPDAPAINPTRPLGKA